MDGSMLAAYRALEDDTGHALKEHRSIYEFAANLRQIPIQLNKRKKPDVRGTSTLIAASMPRIGRTDLAQILVPGRKSVGCPRLHSLRSYFTG
jgi:hypothetical protein